MSKYKIVCCASFIGKWSRGQDCVRVRVCVGVWGGGGGGGGGGGSNGQILTGHLKHDGCSGEEELAVILPSGARHWFVMLPFPQVGLLT